MPNDITKLPVWAQDRIRSAESRVASLERKVDLLFDGEAESNTHWLDLAGTYKPRPLPKGALIRFSIDKYDYIEVRLDDDGHLNMHGNATDLAVKPQAANHILVSFRRTR